MTQATTGLGGGELPRATSENADVATGEHVGGQYVTCFVDDECFAFPMEAVQEIIRLPETISVPLGPPSLKGLANLRGTVLPVVDLSLLLGFPGLAPTDATRVVVADCASPVGLVVDRVERVINVEPYRIEPPAEGAATIESDLLAGVIRASEEGGSLIQLLDARALVAKEFDAFGPEDDGTLPSTSTSGRPAEPGGSTGTASDGPQLVTFELDAEEYGFEISEVREIVRVPDDISRVPGTGEHVLGLVDLRGGVLPLVSLRRLFGLADVPLEEHNRILVLGLAGDSGRGATVGMVVDRIQEVLQVPLGALAPVPALFERQGVEGVQALCRLEGGRRLISLLSVKALFEHPAVQEAAEAHGHGEDMVATMKRYATCPSGEGDEIQLVVFQLAGQEYGVGVERVQEIIWVPDEMSRVPKTPEFVEGVLNLRGTVLPVVDMRARFGIERMDRDERQRILVLNIDGCRTGFIVDAMSEVLRVPGRAVEAAPRLCEAQARVMGRVVNLKEQGRIIQVLDASELLQAGEKETLVMAISGEAGAM